MSSTVPFSDFQKLDIRIGTVIEASVPEWSHWVMKLTVDFGPAFAKATAGKRQRTVFAGIMKFYKPEELVGKQCPFVVNLEPKKMGPMGDFSEGMMLAASAARGLRDKGQGIKGEEDEIPVLFKLWKKVPNGAKVR